jgi:hypothetical protein
MDRLWLQVAQGPGRAPQLLPTRRGNRRKGFCYCASLCRRRGTRPGTSAVGLSNVRGRKRRCVARVATNARDTLTARLVPDAVSGVPNDFMGKGPIPATKAASKKCGLGMNSMDVIESNDAFALFGPAVPVRVAPARRARARLLDNSVPMPSNVIHARRQPKRGLVKLDATRTWPRRSGSTTPRTSASRWTRPRRLTSGWQGPSLRTEKP